MSGWRRALARLFGRPADPRAAGSALPRAAHPRAAALGEALVSLEAVEQGVVDFIASEWDHEHLRAVPSRLEAVRRVLASESLTRAAGLVDRLRDYVIEEILRPQQVPAWEALDLLADAVTGVQHYIARYRDEARVPDPRLLEIVEESIDRLRRWAWAEPIG